MTRPALFLSLVRFALVLVGLGAIGVVAVVAVSARSPAEVIAFISSRDGSYKIYLTDVPRAWTHKLTDQPVLYRFSLSPDRQQIAFSTVVSRRTGEVRFGLYVMRSDGAHLQNLVTLAGNNSIGALSWSPDGRQVVFAFTENGQDELQIMNADGTGRRPLIRDIAEENFPVWSPDGRHIALVSRYQSVITPQDDSLLVTQAGVNRVRFVFYTAITIVEVESGNWRRLFAGSWENSAPVWSPDGQRIAFVSARDGNRELYLAQADGTGLARLTNDPADDETPAWSPDGQQIAFASNRGGRFAIYVIGADGSGLRRVNENDDDVFAPVWSAHGQWLAFQVRRREQSSYIAVVRADGSQQYRLTHDIFTSTSPVWWSQ